MLSKIQEEEISPNTCFEISSGLRPKTTKTVQNNEKLQRKKSNKDEILKILIAKIV